MYKIYQSDSDDPYVDIASLSIMFTCGRIGVVFIMPMYMYFLYILCLKYVCNLF